MILTVCVVLSGMVIMRIEGTIPTQAELTHMVAEVDQVLGPAAVPFD